jgi:4-amino-4-deoxy-L-arabinose transferase-like glycosyltransferase
MKRHIDLMDKRSLKSESPPQPWRLSRVALYVVLAAYVALGSLYAIHTPAWQVPDEPAHYNYIGTIVEQHALPVLQAGDYDQAYLDQLKSKLFPPDLPVTAIRYEGWQPPLYYLLAAPVFAATGGSLVSIRLFTLLIGSFVVVLTWRLAREIFPAEPGLALTAAGFVAFVPQHVAMMAAANNDALTEVLIVLGLWLLVRMLLGAQVPGWALGLVLGLGFLTKLTAYPLAGLIALALLLVARRQGWSARRLISALPRVYVPAILLGCLWWVRNLVVYGGLDFLASQRHDAVVVGQPRTSELLAQWGPTVYARNFVQTTFQSFWGQFGWMGVVMDRRVYWALVVYTAALLIGLAYAFWDRRARRLSGTQTDILVLLVAAILLAVAAYFYYNLTFVQFQGRYLYPALPVFGLGAAIGLRQWARWVTAILRSDLAGPRRWLVMLLPLGPIALMAALDLFALYRFIIPSLT